MHMESGPIPRWPHPQVASPSSLESHTHEKPQALLLLFIVLSHIYTPTGDLSVKAEALWLPWLQTPGHQLGLGPHAFSRRG